MSRDLPAGSLRTPIESRRPPPGAVDWTRTSARRSQSGADPTIFVSRPRSRTDDSPGSRLAAYLLNRIVSTSARVLSKPLPRTLHEQLGANANEALAVLQRFRERGVSPPARLTGQGVAPLRRSHLSDVRTCVLLFDFLKHVVDGLSENTFSSILRQRQFAPEDSDELFEVWVLFAIVKRYLQSGWEVSSARLISSEYGPKRPAFTLESAGQVVEIYYQTPGPAASGLSAYKEIFSCYDLPVALRRPDLTLSYNSDRGSKTMFVEVKRSVNAAYIIESAYKGLGYIADFRKMLGPDSPLMWLVVWGGVSETSSGAELLPLRIVTAQQLCALPPPCLLH